MSTTRNIGARLCAALFVLLFYSTAFAGSAKVEVCHIPLGNPDSYHTIKISQNSLAAHLAHGDLVGACEAGCAVLCDDGDACTKDDTGDCFQNGCPTTPEPVDCSDGLSCTDDSCDMIDGCENKQIECVPSDNCHVSFCAEEDGMCHETEVSCSDGWSCDLDSGECVEDNPEPTYDCPCLDADGSGSDLEHRHELCRNNNRILCRH